MARLVFLANNPDFLVSHRLVLVTGAREAGFDVQVIAPDGAGVAKLEALGVPVHRWQLERTGQRALHEAATVAQVVSLYRRLRPELVHHVTIKPVLYGSFAARVAGVRGVVNAVSGLGYVFLAQGLRAQARRTAIAAAYRTALGASRTRVILQNDDDEADLRRFGALPPTAQVVKIRGSGVDLKVFRPMPEPDGAVPVVVLPARLLREKGVAEFAEAARLLKSRNVAVRMVLVGGFDEGNPASISRTQVEAWVSAGLVESWGHRSDMAEVLRQANIVCLPSYREGMPKALLEAAAVGRAIVTTDAPGCRDVIEHGRLGEMVPVRDAAAIAGAIEGLMEPGVRARKAAAMVEHARVSFSQERVLEQHLKVYRDLLGGR